MILNPFDGNWVLVDAGLKWSAPKIKKMARQLFGDSKPSAIILTHGHFDHVGSLEKLIEEWNVPVYAHYLEIPYLTGKSSYPPPDPSVGGGLMSLMAWAYPSSPINIWNHVNVLPENCGVPGLPEWKFLHTPGHTAGHISLYRESDGVLIAGDAFVTTKAESAISTMLQLRSVSGPPKYFTTDWTQARQSVKDLMKLEPEIVAAGHGKPMQGSEVRRLLHKLSERFYELAVPSSGRYIDEPAVADATGVLYVPENNINKRSMIIKSLAAIAIAATAFVLLSEKQKKNKKTKDALAYEVW
ncbi:MAG TPA: MBL fold metallo-hydrolase, partial [Chitinophagaceae bacterium]|nr:MBL fold metallo-hydrolase [Chitinophagaceae bacterium]